MSIKTRFCPKCGKETTKLVDNVCADCYFKNNGVQAPKKAAIIVCKVCGATNWKGAWVESEYSPDYYLTHSLIDKLKLPAEAELKDLQIAKLSKEGEININIAIGDKEFSQILPIFLEIRKQMCPTCAAQKSRSHQAILQLRSKENSKQFADSALVYSIKYKPNIIKVEETKEGVDIYMSDKSVAQHLASELRKVFRLKKSESFRQYSWDKTRNRPKTRVNILLSK